MEKEMATHSSTLAWRIPWAEEPGRLQSRGSQELDMTQRLNHHQCSKYGKQKLDIYKYSKSRRNGRAFLVVLRIFLAMQGAPARSLVQEDLHAIEQLSPCATTEPALQSPCSTIREATTRRSLCSVVKEQPLLTSNQRKPSSNSEDSVQPKNKNKK